MNKTFEEVLHKYNLDLIEIIEHTISKEIEFFFSGDITEKKNSLIKELEEIFLFPEPFFITCNFINTNNTDPKKSVLSEPVFDSSIPERTSEDVDLNEIFPETFSDNEIPEADNLFNEELISYYEEPENLKEENQFKD